MSAGEYQKLDIAIVQRIVTGRLNDFLDFASLLVRLD